MCHNQNPCITSRESNASQLEPMYHKQGNQPTHHKQGNQCVTTRTHASQVGETDASQVEPMHHKQGNKPTHHKQGNQCITTRTHVSQVGKPTHTSQQGNQCITTRGSPHTEMKSLRITVRPKKAPPQKSFDKINFFKFFTKEMSDKANTV